MRLTKFDTWKCQRRSRVDSTVMIRNKPKICLSLNIFKESKKKYLTSKSNHFFIVGYCEDLEGRVSESIQLPCPHATGN